MVTAIVATQASTTVFLTFRFFLVGAFLLSAGWTTETIINNYFIGVWCSGVGQQILRHPVSPQALTQDPLSQRLVAVRDIQVPIGTCGNRVVIVYVIQLQVISPIRPSADLVIIHIHRILEYCIVHGKTVCYLFKVGLIN